MQENGTNVVELLGCEHMVGTQTTGLRAFVRAVRRGLPWSAADRAKEAFGLADRELARTLGVSMRTLYRHRHSRSPLSPQSSRQLVRAVRVLGYAVTVLQDKAAAMHWMRRPQHGLGGGVPLNLLETEDGARAVERLLGRIDYGVLG